MLPLEIAVGGEVRMEDDDDSGWWDEVVEVELSALAYGRLAEPLYTRLAGWRSWFPPIEGRWSRAIGLGEGAVVGCRLPCPPWKTSRSKEMEEGGGAGVYGEKKRDCG